MPFVVNGVADKQEENQWAELNTKRCDVFYSLNIKQRQVMTWRYLNIDSTSRRGDKVMIVNFHMIND